MYEVSSYRTLPSSSREVFSTIYIEDPFIRILTRYRGKVQTYIL
jgi:hypothetical protein